MSTITHKCQVCGELYSGIRHNRSDHQLTTYLVGFTTGIFRSGKDAQYSEIYFTIEDEQIVSLRRGTYSVDDYWEINEIKTFFPDQVTWSIKQWDEYFQNKTIIS